MKKNQERRLHRKNAKIVKEGGTPLQLNRPSKQETTVSVTFFLVSHFNSIALNVRTETLWTLWADWAHE